MNNNNLPNQPPGSSGPGGFPPPSNNGGTSQPTPPPTSPIKPLTPASPSTPKPSAPPPPEITLRTMKSDLESLKQTGGSTPTPKPFTPEEFKKPMSARPATPPPPSKITPSEFGRPKPPTPGMKPPVPPSPGALKPPTPEITPTIEEEGMAPKFNRKKILLWAGVVVITIGFGLLGYFVIFPALFPPQAPPAPVTTQPTAPPVEVPIEVPIEIPTEIPSVPITQPKLHKSLLTSSDITSAIQLVTTDLLSLTNTLQQEAQKQLPSGTLVEVVITDAGGQALSSVVLNSMLPEFSPDKLSEIFEDDFTAALYYDANGVWPIYIFKLSLEANILEAQTNMVALEDSLNLSNFFLSSPGTANSDGFKEGLVGGLTTRYLTYSNSGAALNYGWSNDKLIISTSYNGLKKVISNL